MLPSVTGSVGNVCVCVCVRVFEALKRDLESTRTKFNEASEKLVEKTRQYQKLQVHPLSIC